MKRVVDASDLSDMRKAFADPRGFGRVFKAATLMFSALSPYVKIERSFEVQSRVFDLYIPACRIFIEIDGPHHFTGGRVKDDTEKMHTVFKAHEGSIFVRIRDVDVLGPLADSRAPHEDIHNPFKVDWVNIVLSLCFKAPKTNACVFIHAAEDVSYAAHIAACGGPWTSISDGSVIGTPPGLQHMTQGWLDGLFEDPKPDDDPYWGMIGEMTL